jgi:hypothetical protein
VTARDEGHEQRALLDLLPDLRIPLVAAAQLALVEPHLNPETAQRLGDALRRVRVLVGVAQEHRAFRRGAFHV